MGTEAFAEAFAQLVFELLRIGTRQAQQKTARLFMAAVILMSSSIRPEPPSVGSTAINSTLDRISRITSRLISVRRSVEIVIGMH